MTNKAYLALCLLTFLRESGNKHFTEHDGFRTQVEVDLTRLQAVIHAKTGLKLIINVNSNNNNSKHSYVDPPLLNQPHFHEPAPIF